MKRLEPLDAFRGLAALAVILLHYTNGYRQDYGHTFSAAWDVSYGYLGVQFFFIISGFVIYSSLNHAVSPLDFYYKRFSRLYPTFWACLFITFFLVLKFGLPGREKDAWQLKANLTMIPKMFHASAIDGAYWSLVPEFFFYIVTGLLFFIGRKNIFFIWGAMVMLLNWLNVFVVEFSEPWQAILNLKWGSLFFAGILFYQLRYKVYRHAYTNFLWLAATLATCFINMKSLWECGIIACFYVVFYLFAIQKLEWFSWRPLVFLGKISFPLYLLHQNLGYIIMNYTKPYLGGFPLIFLLLPIATMIVFAYVVHQFIEVPSLRLLKQLPGKLVFNRKFSLRAAFNTLF